MTVKVILLLALLSSLTAAQTAPPQTFENRFSNNVVSVWEVNLSAHASATPLEDSHDSFWISLNTATVSFTRQQDKATVQFEPGDVRFFPSFETKLLTNSGADDFHGVLVALKPRALITNGCECESRSGKSVCGCKGGGHLDSLWALALGEVTLAGTSLRAGEGFRSAASRDDMLLVAISDLDLDDEVRTGDGDSASKTSLHLKAGETAWIPGGRHQLKNAGANTARFVTFEF